MELAMNLILLGLDAGALALCCIAVFRERLKAGDLILFPILFLLCLVPRIHFIAADGGMTASFLTQGFDIVPAGGIVGLLFLILGVLLLNSIVFSGKASGNVFCGTMAAFSIYLLVRCLSVALFAVCGASGILLLAGSRAASLSFLLLLFCTPFFSQVRKLIQTGGFLVWIVSANIAVLLMAVLSVLSFDVKKFLSHLWLTAILLLAVLLLDSILLFLYQRRLQERKRIHMIEQYVPIVEELISQVRARQHEFNNVMLAMEAAVASADTLEEAKRKVAELTGRIAISPNDRELLSCDSKMIAGMLFGKLKQAEAADIHMDLQLHGLFQKTATPETDWIEVIGILLDNAIEASPRGSMVSVSARKREKYLELLVSNPSPALSNTEFMALFGKGVTSKAGGDGHGFGLYNILRLTERHHGKILTRNEVIRGENHVVFGVLLP